nr:MAG TPA: hypothetical protein [Crassvirales sp.]
MGLCETSPVKECRYWKVVLLLSVRFSFELVFILPLITALNSIPTLYEVSTHQEKARYLFHNKYRAANFN